MKDEIKVLNEVLANKRKFGRAMMVMALVCATLIAIAAIAFYTGAITYHGGKETHQKKSMGGE